MNVDRVTAGRRVLDVNVSASRDHGIGTREE